MKKIVFALLLIFGLYSFAQSSTPPAQGERPQGEQRRGGGMRMGRGVGGTIQSITGDTITLTARDGATVTVKTTADTRFTREGQPAKLSDFKVGDRIMIGGVSNSENNWTADFVGSGMMRRGQGDGQGQSQGQDRAAMTERMREGLGKEFVAGEVKSIDGTTLVVHAPDGKDYTAQVDENTSFRRGRDSITFPEIKVGDRVMGRGKVNANGVFVFENLNAGGFGGGGDRREMPPAAQPKQ
ncbi:MAG: DUF5666 domain-containing protein [Terriglobales bacterium]